MRRTGKTTLVKQLMKSSPIQQKYYFDLERMDNRALSQQGANLYLAKTTLPQHLFPFPPNQQYRSKSQ